MKMILLLLAVFFCSVVSFIIWAPQMGAALKGGRLQRMQQSAQFSGGIFRNSTPTSVSADSGSMVKATYRYFTGAADRTPQAPLPAIAVDTSTMPQAEGLRVTWLGHSTCLVEIEGMLIVTDPMFSERPSPISFMGPKRFAAKPVVDLKALPAIDAVVISHDHYDHLEYSSIQAIHPHVEHFYVPLGVGGHLEKWGVPPEKISELDWWQKANLGSLTFVATPSHHFSGRSFGDSNKTLWCSWVIKGRQHRLFFSGDSGYFNGFAKIGEKYGPFDITLMEAGAYNEAWADIHMLPESTVQAHRELRGEVLLPIHWAGFNLALHPWQEPVERLSRESEKAGVRVTTPRIGEMVIPGHRLPSDRWWRQIAEEI